MYHTFCIARRLTPIESESYFNNLKIYSKRTESKLFPIKKTKTYMMIPKKGGLYGTLRALITGQGSVIIPLKQRSIPKYSRAMDVILQCQQKKIWKG